MFRHVIVLSGLLSMNGFSGEMMLDEPRIDQISPEHGKLNTADATPVDPGIIEVEFSYQSGRARSGFDKRRDTHATKIKGDAHLTAAVTYGIVTDLDISFNLGFAEVRDGNSDGPHDGDGLADSGVGLRWRFFDSAEKN